MKRKPVGVTSLRQFDFFETIPAKGKPSPFREQNLDPLCKALMDKTEAEFFAMFEQPTTPEEK